MIPEGWANNPIKNLLLEDTTGFWGSPPNGKGDVPVLRSTNLRDNGTLDYSKIAYRSFPEEKIVQKALSKNDILLERSGGGPNTPVGRIAYFDGEGTYCFSNFMQRLRPDLKVCNGKFLAYSLWAFHAQGKTSLIQQATTGIRNLNYKEYLAWPILVPPLPEQKKITAILSSVDDAIQATQAVIDQTHIVKQGLMQQLLTHGIGHTRFKQTEIGEIPEEWDVVRLGDVFSHRKEPGISGLPVMSVTMNDGLVERHTLDRRVVSELLPEKHLRAYKGDLVYNMMRMWQGALGVAWNDCIISPAYVLCKPSDLILPRFTAQFFKAPATISKLHQNSQGITEDRLRLYFHNFAEIVIGLPPKIEQEQISDILESIDNEIATHKNELNSLQRIKKGLMEDLLTGHVRVKLDGEAAI